MLRLDIDPETVDLMPTEPAEILTRCLGTGNSFPRKKVLSYAAASPMPICIKFMDAIRTVGKADLEKLPFEAMCVKAEVSPIEMLGAILMSAKSLKATESALKAIIEHPDVVQATVDSAKIIGPAGTADRRILHESLGFLPTKKGGVEINFGFGRPPEDRDEESDADEAWDDAFPEMGDQISEWSSNKHLLLDGKIGK
jgi:hypothetical protein